MRTIPIIAHKTQQAVDAAIQRDQGNAFRRNLGLVLPHIGDAYADDNEPFRSHLGASLIGRECGREIWYSWHWARVPNFNGRMIRLFNRGHLEEGRVIAGLLTIGVQVFQQDENGKQFRIKFGAGHGGGSGDGVALGVPDLPEGMYCLLEFKTHNEKSFTKLKEVGVREAKPEHYAQAQMYMRYMQLEAALYVGVNKNTDEWYCELIQLNIEIADFYIKRAEFLIESKDPPKRISESPGFWKCKFCDYSSLCHFPEHNAPAKNCRTCQGAVPEDDGKWECTKRYIELDKVTQLEGCGEYSRAF